MDNANKRIVRSQNDFNNIETMRARPFPQCIEIGTDRTLLCAALACIDGCIASAQIIFGARLHFGEHETIPFQRDNIHFVATTAPISQEYFHPCATQKPCGVILSQFSALLTKRSFPLFKKK